MIEGETITLAGAAICAAMGYLFGAIPFGLLIAKLGGLGDIRKIGSGNIGATNVLRTGRKWAAASTLVLDGGKGAAAVLIAHAFFGFPGVAMAGLAAILGHVFPVWLQFKGGKGVATSLGVMLAAFWPAGLAMALTWVAVAMLSRISSLSALTAMLLAPAYAIIFGNLPCAALALAIAVIVFITHHENIHRLTHGQEPRIGQR